MAGEEAGERAGGEAGRQAGQVSYLQLSEYNIRLFKLNELLNLNFSIIVQYIDMEI